jgi:hypothetical protein
LTESNSIKRKVFAVLLGDRGSRRRCLIVWVSGTGVLVAAGLPLLPAAHTAWADRSQVDALPLDRVLATLAGCALLVCLVWAWIGLCAAVVEARRGPGPERGRPWHLPAGLRRVVLAACGVALTAGVTAPAVATDLAGHRHGAALLAGLPLPDRAVAPRHVAGSRDHRYVVVRPGDSLWSIAREDLPAGASDADVIARWHAVYAANRTLIGPDPDLIRPGQHLRLPRKDPR